MPEVTPFTAIRFDHTKSGSDLSALIAPPYDVLDESDKDALLSRSDRNIVSIDLPHIPPKSRGPAEVYENAATRLQAFLQDGTLVREERPALYVYHQQFEHEGRSYTRRKFFARVRLHPFADGVVLPHEGTFGGPKEDRLALMQATRCNLSPIFGLYTDPEDQMGAAFEEILKHSPDSVATLDGVENRIWIATDGAVIEAVSEFMAKKRIYIADGHHRYGTALDYRDWATQQRDGALPENHPANYVMFVLASMDDPGCLILPYHRALAGVDLAMVLAAWEAGTEEVSGKQTDITLVEGASGKEVALRFTDRAVLKKLEAEQCDPWYDLDAAYLHRYLIDDLLATENGKNDPRVLYVKSESAARAAAQEKSGVALLVKATPMAHLRAVSEAGGLMPPKSTYFYPKLATGLAINPLE